MAEIALAAGIRQVAVHTIYVHGPNREVEEVSAETSTPCAKTFIDGLFAARWFDPARYSLAARELRAILTHEALQEVTRPMLEPALDVLEDLWQLSHITPSYIGGGGAVFRFFRSGSVYAWCRAFRMPRSRESGSERSR